MGISSSNHFFVLLLALLSLTSAYASRVLMDDNASKKNDDSLKKTMMVDQKWGGGGGGGGGGQTCPGQGSNNCPNQPPVTCPGQGSCNCAGQRPGTCPGQGSGNCAGQCQGSCSSCVGYSTGCVQYVPICQIPCGCSQEYSSRAHAYNNEKWKKIDGHHGNYVHMVSTTNGAMTHRTNAMNSGVVDNEADVVKAKTIGDERTQSPSETNKEEMTRRMDTVNSEVHKKAHVQMASTNGEMTHGVDMGKDGLHNEAHVVTNGEPVKPSMETNGKDETHGLRETASEGFPPPNENEEH